MPDEEIDEREQVLQYAARLQGLSLLRTGDTFALVEYKINGATLDEIAAFLTADRTPALDDLKIPCYNGVHTLAIHGRQPRQQ